MSFLPGHCIRLSVLTRDICISRLTPVFKKITDHREHLSGDKDICAFRGKTYINTKNEEKSAPPGPGVHVGAWRHQVTCGMELRTLRSFLPPARFLWTPGFSLSQSPCRNGPRRTDVQLLSTRSHSKAPPSSHSFPPENLALIMSCRRCEQVPFWHGVCKHDCSLLQNTISH